MALSHWLRPWNNATGGSRRTLAFSWACSLPICLVIGAVTFLASSSALANPIDAAALRRHAFGRRHAFQGRSRAASIRCFKRLAAKTGLKNQSASPGLLEFPPASGGPSKSNGGGARIGNPALMRAPSSLPIPSPAKIRSHPPPDASLSRWLDQVGKRTQANIGAGNAGPHPIPGSSPSPGSDTSATLPQSQSDFPCGPAVFAQALSWRDCARQYRRADRPSLAPQKIGNCFCGAARRAQPAHVFGSNRETLAITTNGAAAAQTSRDWLS